MKALQDTMAPLVTPILLRNLGDGSAPTAVIVRWQRGNVNVGPSDTVCNRSKLSSAGAGSASTFWGVQRTRSRSTTCLPSGHYGFGVAGGS
jgi:hypothetical protein